MHNSFLFLLAAMLCCVSCAPEPDEHPMSSDRWAVYYDKKLPAKAFRDLDVVVFDRVRHPDLKPLQGKVTLLAYVSAGEARKDDRVLKSLKKDEVILSKNKVWGTYVVSLTSARWRGVVMERVKHAIDQGFDGVMLDTLDSPLYYAAQKSDALGEANREAAIQLVNDIRQTYPNIQLMVNRGFEILPEVSGQLDFILAESILAETNVSTRQSQLFPHTTYRQVAGQLLDARETSPQLKIYTLDYWKADDVDGIRELYAIHRGYGFHPYVTTPDLRQLTLEPHSKQKRNHENAEPIAMSQEDTNA